MDVFNDKELEGEGIFLIGSRVFRGNGGGGG